MGSVYATSTALANYVAMAIANKKVAQNYICLPSLQSQPCYGVPYFASLDITGKSPPYSVEIVGGELPPGLFPVMVDFNTFGFQGTPSATGAYYFTIRITSSNGSVMDKSYSMAVMGILNANPLPQATKGQAYSLQLTADGGVAPYTFTLENGSLPAGLTMDSAGLISGTPTTAEVTNFNVTVSDSS